MTDSSLVSISNRYEVLTLLGEGGMGRVYKTRDLTLNREVAVKLLVGQCPEENVPRFQREAKSMSRLKHQNLVDVYDFGVTDDGKAYLVMELAVGVMLSDILKKRTRLTIDETISLILAIADGMYHAHNKGIVHRDLKPSNILILDENDFTKIKVFDFGISKALETSDPGELTRTGAMLGTPPYMSPEQAQGHAVDQRSDQYSLGCIMYTCLVGRPPLLGSTALDTINMQINEHPIRPGAFSELEISKAIDPIVMKLLEKKPEHRYESMASLTEALVEASTQSDITQNPNVIHIRKEQSARTIVPKILYFCLPILLLFGTAMLFLKQPNPESKPKTSNRFRLQKFGAPWYPDWSTLTPIYGGVYQEAETTRNDFTVNVPYLPIDFESLRGKNVKSLTIHRSRLSKDAMDALVSLPNILELYLLNGSITGDKARALNRMTSLERLRIHCVSFDDNDLEGLNGLRQLKLLDLEQCNIHEASIKTIVQNFPNLVNLDLGRTSLLDGKTLSQLSKLEHLMFLTLVFVNLGDDALSNIRCKNLIVLSLKGNNLVTEKGLESLISSNPNLEKIEITACKQLQNREICRRISQKFDNRKLELFYDMNNAKSGLDGYKQNFKSSGGINEFSDVIK